MRNVIQPPSPKSLKEGFCVFCVFVRGHRGETFPRMRMGSEKYPPVHNNKNNNNIYINEIEMICVLLRRIM